MPPGTLPAWLVLLGTLLPLVGIAATAVIASMTRGRSRAWVLAVLPGSVLAVCWWIAPAVLFNGNLLAAVLFMLYYVAICLYYPVLLLVTLGGLWRRRRATAN